MLVAAGILASRLAGLVRQRVLSHFLGLSDAADAFAAAFRIPNFLQNLFGEGVLSASFIPVYARLRAEGREEEARQVAGAVAGLLALVVALVVALGITAAPWLLQLLVPGFSGAKRDLALRLVRILFPGAGVLVLSAWCLGVLNSHRRYFLSYAAPVLWNAAIIAATIAAPTGAPSDQVVVWTAWGAVAGGVLQFGVQLPAVLRLTGGVAAAGALGQRGTRTVLTNFVPAFVARGVVQLSAFIDSMLASFLGTGAVAGLANAQLLYTLPVSLFGMSVAAAELPELSSMAGGGGGAAAALRTRIEHGLRQIAFFIVPSAAAMAALGHVLAAGVFQTGAFGPEDATYVWGILAGSAVGLLAGTLGRLYSSAWYALQDPRTPLRIATVRLALTTGLGWFASLRLPGLLGIAPAWGAAGLTASAGVAAWVEYLLLRRGLDRRLGVTRLPAGFLARLWGSAAVAAAAGWGVLRLVEGHGGPELIATAVTAVYGTAYLAMTWVLGVPMSRELLARLRRR